MQNIPILIPSCDKYSDIWPIFFHSFWLNWPDCPFPIYLGANFKKWNDPRINNILVGIDQTWCANLQMYLDYINSDYVILFLEDFIIRNKIDTTKICKFINIAMENNIDCLRLKPSPPPSRRINNFSNLGEVLKGEPYRISTQVAIWKTEYLRKLAHPKMNIWEFEHFGTLLSDRMEGKVWCVYSPEIDYCHCVERGEWLIDGVKLSIINGYTPDISTRSIHNETMVQKSLSTKVLKLIMKKIPKWLYRNIRRIRPRPELREYYHD